MKAELIKVLKLKRGAKYIIFIPRSTGLKADDVEMAAEDVQEYLHVQATWLLVNDTKGIKVLEDLDRKGVKINDTGTNETNG